MHIPARGERFLFTPHLKRELRPGSAWRGPGRGALAAHRNGRNTPSVGRIFGGELQNIPAGCFARGPLLQEKRGLNLVLDVTFLRFPGRRNRNHLRRTPYHSIKLQTSRKNPAPRAIPWSRIFIFSGDSIIMSIFGRIRFRRKGQKFHWRF